MATYGWTSSSKDLLRGDRSTQWAINPRCRNVIVASLNFLTNQNATSYIYYRSCHLTKPYWCLGQGSQKESSVVPGYEPRAFLTCSNLAHHSTIIAIRTLFRFFWRSFVSAAALKKLFERFAANKVRRSTAVFLPWGAMKFSTGYSRLKHTHSF